MSASACRIKFPELGSEGRLGASVGLGFIGTAHVDKLSNLRGEAVPPVKVCAHRQTKKLDVPDLRKDGMRGDLRHEKRAEAGGAVVWTNDNVEHQGLEYAVGENAGKGQKFLRVGSHDAEDKIGMLEHRSHVREGTPDGPPLALIQRVKLLGLRFGKRIHYMILKRRFHDEPGKVR